MLIGFIVLTILSTFTSGNKDLCGITPNKECPGECDSDGECKTVATVHVVQDTDVLELVVITVVRDWTDSLQRYLRSGNVNGLNVKILGLSQQLEGNNQGGLQNVNLLRKELQRLVKDDPVVLFTDSSSYDVLLLGNAVEILSQFKMSNARILVAVENSCWSRPEDQTLADADEYPEEYRARDCLHAGGYIGYASFILKLLDLREIGETGDNHLYFTRLFMDDNIRTALNIKLDTTSSIFHVLNINRAYNDLDIQFVDGMATLVNTKENTKPLVLLGNGATYHVFNYFGNYLANSWSEEMGCVPCSENTVSISQLDEENLPTVLVALFIERPIPFLAEFLLKIIHMDYPKKKIHLFVHNAAEYHQALVEELLTYIAPQYASVKAILPPDDIKEWDARSLAVDHAIRKNCDYFFSVDGEAHLDIPQTLKMLIEQNRGIISPFLRRPYQNGSNVWGALDSEGLPTRSKDYMDIIDGNRRGLWNVPYISSAYLVNKTIFQNKKTKPDYFNLIHGPNVAFSLNNRNRGIFMYVSNMMGWGHLINSSNFETTHKNNELYQLTDNQWDWEQRYLHPDYWKALDENLTVEAMMADKEWMPCTDVFWLPIVSRRFCNELVGEMENYGKWSDGGKYESRYDISYYENAPTVDINLLQVGLLEEWHEFLKLYVTPLQVKVFNGYNNYPPKAFISFVVRYKPDEQKELKPHHDTSTYTINIALNKAHEDFEGGGCRFTRYNCSVRDTKLGYMLMHPGKLTHEHEGLPVTKGIRYILVSFVDPDS